MKKELIEKAYEIAKERYAAIGVDTDAAMETLQKIQLSLHCWQADDVNGFEDAGALTGGIQTTGNYPGRARNIEELQADIEKVISLVPGNHRLSLHASYADFRQTGPVDRDQLEPKHFESWMEWAEKNGMKLDFNSTSFSHPKSEDLTLASPNEEIRSFWVEHTKRCRAIADEMGRRQGDPAMLNIWVHDGSKDITVNHMKYRAILKQSLDEILEQKYEWMRDSV
ncbi:MAG: L-rhamnose isomerase, partial [Alistipes sp.]|nr:L-rhamnose isomerase [Alistipes sp.]